MTTMYDMAAAAAARAVNGEADYAAAHRAIMGRRAIFTTWEGTRIEGVIEADPRGGQYPIIRFPDGRWARCDDRVELVGCPG